LGLEEGVDFKYIETSDSKDYHDNMMQFIDEGYDILVTVGFALGDATIEMAKEHPEVLFLGVDQFQPEVVENLTGLMFNEDHSGYLAGVLAASMSQSGVIAGVYGTDLVPPVVYFREGYEAGAKATNPDISVLGTYHPGGIDIAFTDPEWGGATAAQAIDQGADFVFGAGGPTGNGALEETATKPGLYCIGVDTDQWYSVPAAQPCLITSAMKLITPAVTDLILMAERDEFPNGNYWGAAGLAPFHDHEDAVPDDLKQHLEDVAAGLIDGSISTGVQK
jgi:basic membrane protein A